MQAFLRGISYVAGEREFHVYATDAALDIARQQADIVRLADMGVRAMLVYPTGEPEALWQSLDYAHEKGVQLFSHDRLGHPKILVTLVTPEYEMGVMGASMMAARLGGTGEVVLVGGVPAPAVLDTLKGFRDELVRHHPGITVIGEVANMIDVEEGAEKAIAELLASGTRFDGIFTYNDSSAVGAATALAAANRSASVVGSNGEQKAIDAIAQGLLVGTVDRNPVELAVRGATAMLDLLEGQVEAHTLPSEIAIDVAPVTSDNVAAFVPWEQRCPDPAKESWTVV